MSDISGNRAEDMGPRKSAMQLVEEAIAKIGNSVDKGSCSDLVRLIQLRAELRKVGEEDGVVKEIKVTWVEPEMECVGEG